MRAAPVLGVLIAAAALAGSSPASRPPTDRALIRKGLTKAVAGGRLDSAEADAYRALVTRAGGLLLRLPRERAAELGGVLHDIAAQRGAYTRPRALTLFSTLELNENQLASHPLPKARTDVRDSDGIVYRYFPGHGFVFHPLAEFVALDAAVSDGDPEVVETLAQALLQRAIPSNGGLAWEYEFPFGSGRAPWTSGMAEAVAAQALARAGDLLSDASLLDAADAAYAGVPGRLVQQLSSGPWIRLYSFLRLAVLNAQLQTILSLGDYAEISGNGRAAALVQRLTAAAKALLPRFDTGYWSLYALGGREAPGSYHDYVVELLQTLSTRDEDPIWKAAADRFAAYERQPPIVRPGRSTPTLYPLPADGYLDVARFHFWLSKLSWVTLRVGGHSFTLHLAHGAHTFVWTPKSWQLGVFHPYLRAEDGNGHTAVVALDPVRVRTDLTRPELEVQVTAPARLSWSSTDEGTPWLALAVHLDAGPKHRVLKLGRRGRSGTVALRLPPGRWHARLVAVNSAGRLRGASLGFLPR